jgi:hypothetical protein
MRTVGGDKHASSNKWSEYNIFNCFFLFSSAKTISTHRFTDEISYSMFMNLCYFFMHCAP